MFERMKRTILLFYVILLAVGCSKKPSGTYVQTINVLGAQRTCEVEFLSGGKCWYKTAYRDRQKATWEISGEIVKILEAGQVKRTLVYDPDYNTLTDVDKNKGVFYGR